MVACTFVGLFFGCVVNLNRLICLCIYSVAHTVMLYVILNMRQRNFELRVQHTRTRIPHCSAMHCTSYYYCGVCVCVVQEGGEGEEGGKGKPKREKRLKNQFNYSERASQTLNNPFRVCLLYAYCWYIPCTYSIVKPL